MADVFADGEAYERYMGRWSRLVAPPFVAWLGQPPGARWLDVGCGTGALTSAVLAAARPGGVLAVDRSAAFVETARRALARPDVTVEVAPADALPAGDHAVDVAVSGLVLNFLPDVPAALREQVRVVRLGGAVAAYVWDYAEGMRMLHLFWRAAAEADPGGADLNEGARFPICRPDALRAAWRDAGLENVTVEALEVSRRFASFDELWAPFLGGQGAAGGYLAEVDGARRSGIAERFRALLPVAPDGSIELRARAWAVRGVTPHAPGG